MIEDEKELRATQQRVERFHSWLVQLRQTALPSEFDAVASGYRLEIERMQAEILDYLLRPAKAREVAQPA
jgi:pyridoxal/pyridoxine/pyridoxamine kinase